MEAKDLIKEIDPDYLQCRTCKRKLHKSKLIRSRITLRNLFECKERSDCLSFKWKEGKYSEE